MHLKRNLEVFFLRKREKYVATKTQRKKIAFESAIIMLGWLAMKENRFLEFKSEVSNSFLKTVSAFSNIGTGIIKFGYNDDGSVCGISNIDSY